MRFTDFVKELDDAGWQGVHDAQLRKIAYLHKKLFPIIAELEDENVELAEQVYNLFTEKEINNEANQECG